MVNPTYRPAFLVCLVTIFIHHSLCAEPVANPGSRGVDWERVREKVSNYSWAADIVSRMKNSVQTIESRYEYPPLGTTGWLHEYYCDDDARRLLFDPNKPTEHVCTKCGRVYSGPPYDDCWRSLVHSEIATAAAQSAILYRIAGEKSWLDYPRKILLWYAGHFEQFEPHGAHAGKGIIREQSLDEATHLVRLAQAYWDICPDLSPEDRRIIADKFLVPDARFIHQQTRSIHNIHSWHNAAVGLVGLAVGDQELASQAIDGEFGLKKQIEKGINGDGFWYEGSISYHYYTISSLEPLYVAARAREYSLEGTDQFRLTYIAPIQFAFSNGEFPATNDGWPEQSLVDQASYYEIACTLWDDSILPQTLASMYTHRKRNSIEALLYGPADLPPAKPLAPQSVLFKNSGIAILRNERVNAYLKFGPYGGGHDHLDRLNMILYAGEKVIMPDLGTSGYGIPLNAWYRASAAHNLLVVDGKKQKRCSGYLIDYKDTAVSAGVKDAYDGVDIQRSLTLIEDGVRDDVRAVSGESHQYDLFYHVRGTLKSCTLPLQEAKLSETSNGYEYLNKVEAGQCERQTDLSIIWTLRDAPGELTLRCSSPAAFEFFLGECPDNPADETLSVLMLRAKQNNAEWKAWFTISR